MPYCALALLGLHWWVVGGWFVYVAYSKDNMLVKQRKMKRRRTSSGSSLEEKVRKDVVRFQYLYSTEGREVEEV